MATPVVAGAQVYCPMGQGTGALPSTGQPAVLLGGAPVACTTDITISPCGMCISMGNPAVASATAAAMGVLTPQPCTPTPAGTWQCSPGPIVGGKPILMNDGALVCSLGGTITVTAPGQGGVQC